MASNLLDFAKVIVPGIVILAWLVLLIIEAFNPAVVVPAELSTAAIACLGVFGGVIVERAQARLR